MALLFLRDVVKSAIASTRFVLRIYRHGWYRRRDGSLGLTYPLWLWWAGFWDNPFISITRHDNGITVYWPGREPLADEDGDPPSHPSNNKAA
jgi:hypothetical protein